MRFFETTAHYVRMIGQTVSDIKYFLLIQLIFVLTFGFTEYFINSDRIRDADQGLESVAFIPEHFDNGIADMFIN